jgi:hypothetical protein
MSTAAKTRLDPHAVAARILPKLEPLNLSYLMGSWWRPNYRMRKGELEAIVSRLLRMELDAMGNTERPVTSALVREIILALASMLSAEAARLTEVQ